MPLTSQQCYPFHPLRINGRNGNRDSGDPLGNGRHYPPRSNGRCDGPYGVSGSSDGGPPDDP